MLYTASELFSEGLMTKKQVKSQPAPAAVVTGDGLELTLEEMIIIFALRDYKRARIAPRDLRQKLKDFGIAIF